MQMRVLMLMLMRMLSSGQERTRQEDRTRRNDSKMPIREGHEAFLSM
jgi:hypothetical protein